MKINIKHVLYFLVVVDILLAFSVFFLLRNNMFVGDKMKTLNNALFKLQNIMTNIDDNNAIKADNDNDNDNNNNNNNNKNTLAIAPENIAVVATPKNSLNQSSEKISVIENKMNQNALDIAFPPLISLDPIIDVSKQVVESAAPVDQNSVNIQKDVLQLEINHNINCETPIITPLTNQELISEKAKELITHRDNTVVISDAPPLLMDSQPVLPIILPQDKLTQKVKDMMNQRKTSLVFKTSDELSATPDVIEIPADKCKRVKKRNSMLQ